jgi:uncharacterized protein YbcI
MSEELAHPLARGGSLGAALTNLVVRTFGEYTGRGPTNARAYFSDELVTVVLRDLLTKGERSLVDSGHEGQVLGMRLAFQHTMRDELVEGFEALTGRKVAAFLSANHVDPDIAVETFVLEPLGDGDAAQPPPADAARSSAAAGRVGERRRSP